LLTRLRGLLPAHIDVRTLGVNLAVLFSFVLPLFILYLHDPASFQLTWKGRALYLFFLWLFVLELAMAWKKLHINILNPLKQVKTLITAAIMAAPTIYVIAVIALGLKSALVELGKLFGLPGRFGEWLLQYSWPLSLEYLILAAFYTTTLLLIYKIDGLKKFLVALFFLWAAGVFYTIDTFYPLGLFGALQIFVPFTASSAASILRLMGYKAVEMGFTDPSYGLGSILAVIQGKSLFSVTIFWPCAGIHSFVIYAFVILLFVKEFAVSLPRKVLYIVIGAIGTFLANVLRIVTICTIGLRIGNQAAEHFHSYYGELFFVTWVLIYLPTIVYGPRLIAKLAENLKKPFKLQLQTLLAHLTKKGSNTNISLSKSPRWKKR